jgi:hypothetical protein
MSDEMNIEAALKTLRPAAARLDPIAAAFDAGRASARRVLRAWQSATAAALLLAITAVLVPTQRSTPATAEPSHAATLFIANPAPQSLFRLQQAVEQRGIDALPSNVPPSVTFIRANDVY